jgi:hypothetical protein
MSRRSKRIAQKVQVDVKPQLPPLTDFTLFSQLPAEIRSIIWNLSLQPRVVDIRTITLDHHYFYGAKAAPYPEAFRVSRDSRNAVLAQYSPCFGTFWDKPCLRFNFALDILHLGCEFTGDIPVFFNTIHDKDVAKILFLAIDMAMFKCQ